MKATIVTVTHKSEPKIAAYVDSFLTHHRDHFTDAIEFNFVENSSSQHIANLIAPLTVAGYSVNLQYMENRGFGAACNLGAMGAAGTALMFINPDVTFTEPLSNAEDIAGTWGTGRQFGDNGRLYSFDILPEHKKLFDHISKRHLKMTPPPQALLHQLFPVGAFFCVDRAIFHEVGGFDERFFLYYEEAELARRLQKIAGPPRFFENLTILHHQFGSEDNRLLTWAHELDGLFTYSTIIGCNVILWHRFLLLLALAPFRSIARARLRQFIGRLHSGK